MSVELQCHVIPEQEVDGCLWGCSVSFLYLDILILLFSLNLFLSYSQSQDSIQLNQYKLKSEIGKVRPLTSFSYCVVLITTFTFA